MKIIWVTPQLPSLRSGGQVRQYNLIRYLSKHHKVVILSLKQPGEEQDIEVLQDLGIEVFTEQYTIPAIRGIWINRIKSWLQLLGDPKPQFASVYPIAYLEEKFKYILRVSHPDIIYIELLFAAPLSKLAGNIIWILDEQNVESLNLERQLATEGRIFRRIWGKIESYKLGKWETYWVKSATACTVVSKDDLIRIKRMAPEVPITVIPNGVDTTLFSSSLEKGSSRQDMVFFGTLGYAPNRDALLYFCREILPLIHNKFPELRLNVIGPHAPTEIKELHHLQGINVLGYVDDIRPYLLNAAVCLVPLRSGGGTRLKILEAMAAGVPVVSTTIGAEGLDVLDRKNILLADSPKAFATAIFQLLENPDLAAQISEQARNLVETKYDWKIIGQQLEEFYRQVLLKKNKISIQL